MVLELLKKCRVRDTLYIQNNDIHLKDDTVLQPI